MHIWADLAARELAFLGLLLALGLAPASFLGDRFDLAGRLALAPVLGFCLGTCVFVTTIEFVAADDTYWLVVPLAVACAAIGIRRLRRARRRGELAGPSLRDAAQIALVCLCVVGPLTAVLHARHTVGPVAYSNTDVDTYVGDTDAARTTSLRTAAAAWRRAGPLGAGIDPAQWNWAFVADLQSNVDAAPIEANLNALLGLGATDTWAADLIVLLASGGLAAFAAVRHFTRSRSWAAVLGGGLFGGPLFLELWFDNYQAALCGLGVFTAAIVVGDDALRTGRRAQLGLLALVLAGLLAVYPYFVAILLLGGAIVLGARAVAERRAGRPLRPLARALAVRCAGVGAATFVLDPVGCVRAARFSVKVLDNDVALPRVAWRLPLDVLPGWLAQTREFWAMPSLAHAGPKQLVLGGLLPAVVVAAIAFGARRRRPAVAGLLVLAGVCGAVAEYSYASRDACTYCAERNLLPVAPIVAVLLGIGVWALVSGSSGLVRWAGVLAAAIVVVGVGQRARVELTRFYDASYFLDSADRAALARLPHAAAGGLELEGFGESLASEAELPLVYYLANERDGGRVSLPEGADDYSSLFYLTFGQTRIAGPNFRPDYEYVLTRLPGIDTDRRVVARSGPVALEQRVGALDISPYSGVAVPVGRLDPAGTAWIQPNHRLAFTIVGATRGAVWARVSMHGLDLSVVPGRGITLATHGAQTVVCVRATGSAPLRLAGFNVTATLVRAPVPAGEQFPPQLPQVEAVLDGMQAVSGHCTP